MAGIGLGGALALIATARRTASAHDRYLASADVYDYATGYVPTLIGGPMDRQLAGVPGVAETQQLAAYVLDVDGISPTEIGFHMAWVDDVGRLEKPHVIEGRLLHPDAADEVVINEEAAVRSGLRVGDELSVEFQVPDFEDLTFQTLGVTTEVQVVGIVRMPDEVLLDEYRKQGLMLLSPAFDEQFSSARTYGTVHIRMTPGASPQPVLEALAEFGLAFDENRAQERARVWQSVRPLVTVVGITGGLALVAAGGLLVLALLGRRFRTAAEDTVLGALGASRRDIERGHLLTALIVAAGVIVVATFVVVVTSPLAPIGPYREVDPARGVHADWVVLGAGALGIAACTVLGQRMEPSGLDADRPALRFTRLPLPVGLGARWALGSLGRSTVGPLVAMTAALGTVAATVVFLGSVDELGRQPTWYGQQWDAVARLSFGAIDIDALLEDDPDVRGWSVANIEGGSVNGAPIAILGVTPGAGGPRWPVITSGHPPGRPTEALIGAESRARLGIDIGDTIEVVKQDNLSSVATGAAAPRFEVTVVGTAIFANAGYRGTDPPRLGEGLAVDDAVLSEAEDGTDTGSLVFVDLRPGADVAAFVGRHEGVTGIGSPFVVEWITDLEPVEVAQASDAASWMWGVVVVLALVAAVMLAGGLAGSVRRRRRDYGVLRAVGFTGRQLWTTVVAQAYSGFLVAAAVGALVGVSVGRALWLAFARSLDVLPRATVPGWSFLLVGSGATIAIALVVIPSAWAAQRTSAAQALRSE